MKKFTSLMLLLSLVVMGACSSADKKEEVVEEAEKVEVKVGEQLLGTVYFDTNVYDKVASTDFDSMKDIVEKVSAATGEVTILVHGHTDRVGTEAYNKKLSIRRAEFVKKQLVDAGVDSNNVVTEGFGFSKPVEEEADDQSGNSKNRRAEIILDVTAQ